MTLAAELGPRGIRVNAIAPGTTFTEEIRAVIGAEQFAAISASTPLQRVCDPDELARLTVFLASDLSRCITGQLILADAGAHLGRLPLKVPDDGEASLVTPA
jgi:3-oxoacyl-[acyl-carrier protein] reductase